MRSRQPRRQLSASASPQSQPRLQQHLRPLATLSPLFLLLKRPPPRLRPRRIPLKRLPSASAPQPAAAAMLMLQKQQRRHPLSLSESRLSLPRPQMHQSNPSVAAEGSASTVRLLRPLLLRTSRRSALALRQRQLRRCQLRLHPWRHPRSALAHLRPRQQRQPATPLAKQQLRRLLLPMRSSASAAAAAAAASLLRRPSPLSAASGLPQRRDPRLLLLPSLLARRRPAAHPAHLGKPRAPHQSRARVIRPLRRSAALAHQLLRRPLLLLPSASVPLPLNLLPSRSARPHLRLPKRPARQAARLHPSVSVLVQAPIRQEEGRASLSVQVVLPRPRHQEEGTHRSPLAQRADRGTRHRADRPSAVEETCSTLVVGAILAPIRRGRSSRSGGKRGRPKRVVGREN